MDIKPGRYYQHVKSGDIYQVLHVAIECTNARSEGLAVAPRVVVYRAVKAAPEVFTRDYDEFTDGRFVETDT